MFGGNLRARRRSAMLFLLRFSSALQHVQRIFPRTRRKNRIFSCFIHFSPDAAWASTFEFAEATNRSVTLPLVFETLIGRSVATRCAPRNSCHAYRRKRTPHLGLDNRDEPAETGNREPLAQFEDGNGNETDEQHPTNFV